MARFSHFLCLGTVLVIASCAKSAPEAPASGSSTTPSSPQAQASHETPAPAAAPAGAVQTVQGRVLESLDAAGYTYVRVKTDASEIWAATLPFKVAIGDTVIVPLENPMRNFRSQAMKREFELVYFVSRISKPGEAPQSTGTAGLPPGHPATNPSATPEAMLPPEPNAKLIDPITPPAGGTSIAKVWADRKTLSGKQVTIRGKVIKYNAEIMGLNWLHVQDGSGSVKDGTHDLTVTSSSQSRVGDIVTITGTVVVDKNFGAGYGYAVMLQGAKIAK